MGEADFIKLTVLAAVELIRTMHLCQLFICLSYQSRLVWNMSRGKHIEDITNTLLTNNCFAIDKHFLALSCLFFAQTPGYFFQAATDRCHVHTNFDVNQISQYSSIIGLFFNLARSPVTMMLNPFSS